MKRKSVLKLPLAGRSATASMFVTCFVSGLRVCSCSCFRHVRLFHGWVRSRNWPEGKWRALETREKCLCRLFCRESRLWLALWNSLLRREKLPFELSRTSFEALNDVFRLTSSEQCCGTEEILISTDLLCAELQRSKFRHSTASSTFRPPSYMAYKTSMPSMLNPEEPPKIYPFEQLMITNFKLPPDVDRDTLEVKISSHTVWIVQLRLPRVESVTVVRLMLPEPSAPVGRARVEFFLFCVRFRITWSPREMLLFCRLRPKYSRRRQAQSWR